MWRERDDTDGGGSERRSREHSREMRAPRERRTDSNEAPLFNSTPLTSRINREDFKETGS